MSNTFKDHFSSVASEYRSYRPGYPDELFTWLGRTAPASELAWDCATGSGQAALGLSEHFSQVVASDASAEQVAHAGKRANITYFTATAESSGLETGTIDLVTVAQALHWFDIDAFGLEALRVLKPGGILAVWTYNLLEATPEIDRIVQHLYADILGDYWPFERNMVEQGYAGIEMPLTEIKAPHFSMQAEWNLLQLLGYLNTWSALRRCREAQGTDPLEAVADELAAQWGEASRKRLINWPLSLKVWKKS